MSKVLALAFKATEMKEAKVARISLVDHAATRMPFKVIKQEKSMNPLKHLDLASVFKREKPAAAAPEVVGVITLKSEGYESVAGQIGEAGFVTTAPVEMEDGSVVFGQGTGMADDSTLVRISENAVLAVKGLVPYDMDLSFEGGTEFATVCKTQGFYPGVGSVIDTLRTSVLTLAEKSENMEATLENIEKMFDEAKQYAVTMVQSLPAKAFKLEFVFPEESAEPVDKGFKPFVKGGGTADDNEDPNKDTPELDKDGNPIKPMKAKKEDGSEGNPADAGGNTPAPVVESVTSEKVAEIVGAQMAEFTAKMESMFAGVQKSVADAAEEVKTLGTRVESAEQIAKSAQKALEGTVVLGGASEAGDHVEVARKREVRSGREIDTGFRPVARRQASR